MYLNNEAGVASYASQMSLLERLRNQVAEHIRFTCVRARCAQGLLSICFDDFPKNAWTVGGAILREHGIRGTYYVAGSLCGQRWEGKQQYDCDDLQALYDECHEIGSHLYSHTSVRNLSAAELRDEIATNDRFVRDVLGNVQVASFAYPYGEASLMAKHICGNAFSSSRGIVCKLNDGWAELAHLRSFCLERRSIDTIDWEALIEETAKRKAWLIITTHDVDETASPFGCHPKHLDQILRVARSTHLKILPVKEALAEFVSNTTPNITAGLSNSASSLLV